MTYASPHPSTPPMLRLPQQKKPTPWGRLRCALRRTDGTYSAGYAGSASRMASGSSTGRPVAKLIHTMEAAPRATTVSGAALVVMR